MANAVKHLYEFGPFQLDPGERLLRRGEERLDLPPRVFDTLLALAESEGRLLEKDALMDRIWPDAAVEENNLTQAIYLLRKVLQDGENGNRYIETVPKRGYRFVAQVRDVVHDSSSRPARIRAFAGHSGQFGSRFGEQFSGQRSPVLAMGGAGSRFGRSGARRIPNRAPISFT